MWESGLALSFISFLKIDICFCRFRHFHLNASLIIFTSLAMESTSLFNLLYYFVYTKSLFSKIFRAFRNSRRHYFVCFRKDNHIVSTPGDVIISEYSVLIVLSVRAEYLNYVECRLLRDNNWTASLFWSQPIKQMNATNVALSRNDIQFCVRVPCLVQWLQCRLLLSLFNSHMDIQVFSKLNSQTKHKVMSTYIIPSTYLFSIMISSPKSKK